MENGRYQRTINILSVIRVNKNFIVAVVKSNGETVHIEEMEFSSELSGKRELIVETLENLCVIWAIRNGYAPLETLY